MNARLTALLAPARAAYAGLAPRERAGVLIAVVALVVLLGWLLMRPAWRAWQEVPRQREALSIQLLQMQQLAAEAKALRGMPAVSPDQARQSLTAATERLGAKAKLTLQGDRAVVQFTGVAPEAWRAWLAEVRSGARARPTDAQLNIAGGGLSGTMTLATGGAP